MKIYTNINYDILSLDTPPEKYDHEFETDLSREELFGNHCDAYIRGYRYVPNYVMIFNDDGSIKYDEQGNIQYKTDRNGNKLIAGYQCYPFIDYQTLLLIQAQYEDQTQINDLICIMADIIGGVYNA